MSDASYERQHLAVHAAGFINAAGTTRIGFGCLLTRFAAGHYGLLLDASAGVVDDQTFTMVTPKSAGSFRVPSVVDTSSVQKNIRVFDQSGVLADTDIEIAIFKSVAQ